MRVLMVSPGFRGYWRSYRGALEELGHEVQPFLYEHFPTGRDKLANKLRHELPRRLGRGEGALRRRTTADALRFMDGRRFDAALVIKGDLLDEPFWDELDRRGVPSVLYLYDDLGRMLHTDASLARAGHVASYAPRDVDELRRRGHAAELVPLFYDHRLPFTPVAEQAVVFVGARYPDRERTLTTLAARGTPVVAYGRDWSHRLTDRLRSWELHRPPVPGRPDVTLAESFGIAAGAAAAINMHADHDGFNNRTFEICGVGGLELTHRADVSAFYEPGEELLVYSSEEELGELAERALRDRRWTVGIREAARRRTAAEHTCVHRCRALAELW